MLSTSSQLVVRLDTPLPASLPVGKGTAMFANGACFHPHREVRSLHLRVDGATIAPAAWPAPRLDLALALAQPRAYRSGFWATVPVPAGIELAPPRREVWRWHRRSLAGRYRHGRPPTRRNRRSGEGGGEPVGGWRPGRKGGRPPTGEGGRPLLCQAT